MLPRVQNRIEIKRERKQNGSWFYGEQFISVNHNVTKSQGTGKIHVCLL